MIAIDAKAFAREIAAQLEPRPEKLLYSAKEAAKALGISPTKLNELRAHGHIRAIKPPGLSDWRYPAEDIKRWAGAE